MIARFIEHQNRRRLGFSEAVVREFEFVQSTYDFCLIEESETLVRYESKRLFLKIFHGRSSYEIGIELGELSNPAVHYGLPSLISALADGHTGRTSFQASERQAVENCVAEVARIVKLHCTAALTGDREALRMVRNVAQEESRRLTLWAQYGAIIDKADRAWESKNLRLATDLYQEAQPALDKTRTRRLRYLLGKRGKPASS